MQAGNQIHQTEITLCTLLAAGLEETKDSQTEIDCHNDDVAMGGQLGAIVGIARIPVIRFAMYKDHSREQRLRTAAGT